LAGFPPFFSQPRAPPIGMVAHYYLMILSPTNVQRRPGTAPPNSFHLRDVVGMETDLEGPPFHFQSISYEEAFLGWCSAEPRFLPPGYFFFLDRLLASKPSCSSRNVDAIPEASLRITLLYIRFSLSPSFFA